MKKYLYTLLFMAVALFSAAAMVSCGDDDDDDIVPGGDPNTNTKEMRSLYFYDNGNQYLNRQYKLTVGSETITIKVDDLKKVTEVPEAIQSLTKLHVSVANQDGLAYSIYNYEIPADKHGAVTLSMDYSVKDGVELPDEMDFFVGACSILGDGNSLSIDGKTYLKEGVSKDKLQYILDTFNGPIAEGKVK
ncbi:MAG: hypothetical protein MJZ29_10175 [Bacteroidaceae bacterium]|nr:hypothetical protein [Bacteroidaceae bacterium]